MSGAKFQAKKKQTIKKKVVVKVKGGADEPVTVIGDGSIKLGKKRHALKQASKGAAAGQLATLKLMEDAYTLAGRVPVLMQQRLPPVEPPRITGRAV